MYKKTKFDNIFITKTGEVYKKELDKYILIPFKLKKGRPVVYSKHKNNNSSSLHIHQLVAEAYVNNVNNYKYIIHIDGNKLNNNWKNLMWSLTAYKKGTPKPRLSKVRPLLNCAKCGILVSVRPNRKKFCSRLCSQRNAAKYAGKASAAVRYLRGKNEIHFANLCTEYFKEQELLFNKPIFNGWDADIVIPHLKIAVLWNGVHHYKTVYKQQSLLQVQNRDKIKHDQIILHGYIPYIIKDMGKANKIFVEEKFKEFIEYLKNNNLL